MFRDNELRCDMCGDRIVGRPLNGDPKAPVECTTCEARSVGYTEGSEQGARELLEMAVLWAAHTLDADEIRSDVEHLLKTRSGRYVEIR